MGSVRKFFILGLVSEFLYLLFYLIKPESFVQIVILLLVLFLIYIFGTNLVSSKKISAKHVLIFALLFNLSLLFVWNVASDDLFTYIYRSRIFSEYGANPYVVPYDRFPQDIFYNQIKTIWSSKTAIYGPLIVLFGSLFTLIGGENLFVNIILFKMLFVFLNILSTFLVYRITRDKMATYLYGWNPLILFELSLNNHNEVVMIALFLLAIYYLFKKSSLGFYLRGWVSFVLSVLTKFMTAILTPFYLLFVLKKIKKTNKKVKFLLATGLLGIFLVVLLHIPFWRGPEIYSRLFSIAKSQSTSPSIGIAALSLILPFKVAKKINLVIFLFIYLIFIFKILRQKILKKKQFLGVLLFVYGTFLATYFSLFMPWYTTLFIAIACVYVGFAEGKKARIWIYVATLYSIFLYVFL